MTLIKCNKKLSCHRYMRRWCVGSQACSIRLTVKYLNISDCIVEYNVMQIIAFTHNKMSYVQKI